VAVELNNIVVHYGEVALKGKNRADFVRRLRQACEHRLARAGLRWPVREAHQYLYVKVPEVGRDDLDTALEVLTEVPGVVWLAPACRLPAGEARASSGDANLEPVIQRLLALAQQSHVPGGRFRVSVKRADKGFPVSSGELQKQLGSEILQHTDWQHVDLHSPDRTFYVDVYPESIYVYDERLAGLGGLPPGASGRMLAMLSGGIDSPAAAYLMTKRGCALDFVHFTATRSQQADPQAHKIARLAARLSRYSQRSSLYVLPYTPFELATLTMRTRYELIIFRRFMARVAERLAGNLDARGLVMGDSLGQVASQTLENIDSLTRAVTLPILRPLIGYDKKDIVALARRIGTYDTSIEEYKDCCALLSQHPKTASHPDRIAEIEAEVLPGYGEVIDETLAQAVRLDFDCGECTAISHAETATAAPQSSTEGATP